MTGFGKAEAVLEHKKITVEIRSLNSKQLDLSMRVPSIYRQSEYEIRNLVAKRMLRGKVDVYISYEIIGKSGSVALNREVFGDYLAQLRSIAAENGLPWNEAMAPAALTAVLRLPDAVQNEAADIPDEEIEALKGAVCEALDRMDAFRQQEGAILIADLLGRIDRIERLKNDILPYEKARTENIRNRIRENIESLGIAVDGNRLEQEMIYYLEKLDVTEEKVRLQNHCDYFREVSRSEDGVGRKLGFIAQEMGREINTLGSKANEATMQKMVVGMKDELEKIKEQLLNIL